MTGFGQIGHNLRKQTRIKPNKVKCDSVSEAVSFACRYSPDQDHVDNLLDIVSLQLYIQSFRKDERIRKIYYLLQFVFFVSSWSHE